MTTKEQERQAIEKIRKIVEGLGENSYIGFAMEGVLELAETNIEEDAAYSMKQSKDTAIEEMDKLQGRVNELENYIKETELELAREREDKGKFAALAEKRRMPRSCYQELYMIVSSREDGDMDYITELADRLSDSVGDGTIAGDIEETAKKYKKAKEQLKTDQMLLDMLDKYDEENKNKLHHNKTG